LTRSNPTTIPKAKSKDLRSPRASSVARADLGVEVKKMIVASDYVTVHMVFTGHFTGRFGQTEGRGQFVSFIATDLLKVTDGLVTDNWHIEDNLTLMKQLGVVTQ
jgi:predicted ester cyclase